MTVNATTSSAVRVLTTHPRPDILTHCLATTCGATDTIDAALSVTSPRSCQFSVPLFQRILFEDGELVEGCFLKYTAYFIGYFFTQSTIPAFITEHS